MKLMLDTTIQIDRIFCSKIRRDAINSVIKDFDCYCSSYVLGEFYATIISDYITIYHVLFQEDDIYEAEKRVSEIARSRQQDRMHKIFIDLRNKFDNDISQMRGSINFYITSLINRFFKGINSELIDSTDCNRSKARIEDRDNILFLTNQSCKKTDMHCEICEFWELNKHFIMDADISAISDTRLKGVFEKIKKNNLDVKGNNCRTLGDSVITLESLHCENKVCSSNKKDFSEICNIFGVELISPDYSTNNKIEEILTAPV